MKNWLLIIPMILMLSTSSCALWPFGSKAESEEDDLNTNEKALYEEAQSAIRSGNFTTGIERLELIETHFPFGQYAEQAQLELIFANFMKADYDAVTLAAERFIDLHPQHPNVDYAYYLRGLASYERNRGFFDRLLGSPESTRDTTSTRQSFLAFNEFLQKYPDSLYAKDARLRMIQLRNILAEAELNVAEFYLQRDSWVAAVNRASEVVQHFPTTESVPYALAIMVEANYKLDLPEAANDALRVLKYNFPDFENFDEDGNFVFKSAVRNRDRSLMNVVTFGLMDRPDVPPPIQIASPGQITPPTREDS